jgi:hypothetical protein
MQEYKREKAGLEATLDRMAKAAAHHDNHLRAIDAWFRQVSPQNIISTSPLGLWMLTLFEVDR